MANFPLIQKAKSDLKEKCAQERYHQNRIRSCARYIMQGSIKRADVVTLLGVTERSTRRVTSSLLGIGDLQSESTRAPLQLAFPANLAGRWMPGLFPDE